MIWLLPVILVGGMFYSPLGLIVFLMMLFFLILSYFKGRYWCSHLCPRGAFLDLVLSRLSLKKKIPAYFRKPIVRLSILGVFMLFFITQLIYAERTVFAVGFVFVRMCLLTTLIAIFLGLSIHQRAWCTICPMGTLQDRIHSLKRMRK